PTDHVFDRGERLRLIVEEQASGTEERCCSPLLAAVQTALVEAHRLQQLPDTYTDVTQGRFASWKAWLKRKLLGNFKQAYVDVLSRQQTAFNQRVLAALHELAECCATLASASQWRPAAAVEHLVREGKVDVLAAMLEGLMKQVAENQRRFQTLEERLARLEETDKANRFPSPVY